MDARTARDVTVASIRRRVAVAGRLHASFVSVHAREGERADTTHARTHVYATSYSPLLPTRTALLSLPFSHSFSLPLSGKRALASESL